MNSKNQKNNWLLDFLILACFLVAFFMDLTGLALHQWLGVFLGLLIMIHLLSHWDWVKCVLTGFFRKTSARAKLYLVVDALLLYGMVMIIETGLVISSWFNLELTNYEVWVDLHVFSAVITLLLALLKLGLHWRWIAKTSSKIFKLPTQPVKTGLPVVNAQALSRRQFLVTMGVISLGSALAIGNVLSKNEKIKSVTLTEDSNSAETKIATESGNIATAQATGTQSPTQGSTNAAVETATPTAGPTSSASSTAVDLTAVENELVCSGRCPKGNHCSYPGRCGRYQDGNANGLCDLGECG